jgi:hypothetical protein
MALSESDAATAAAPDRAEPHPELAGINDLPPEVRREDLPFIRCFKNVAVFYPAKPRSSFVRLRTHNLE